MAEAEVIARAAALVTPRAIVSTAEMSKWAVHPWRDDEAACEYAERGRWDGEGGAGGEDAAEHVGWAVRRTRRVSSMLSLFSRTARSSGPLTRDEAVPERD